MVFTGTYEHSIDAKNRLAIPAEIRAQLWDARPERVVRDAPVSVYVTLGEKQSLCLYTEQSFEQRASELDRSELDPEEVLEYERLWYSLSRKVEIDAQGRVRMPDHLLEMAGLGKDVVLIGAKDRVEIRDRQSWHAHVKESLARRPNMLMNPRRAMKPPKANEEPRQ
ncbi:MAG: hypothetical protein K8S99_13520 [Planctomycetes bacterium]|nr:hypothetical protein [Planctomycetota bacterium]